MRQQFTDYDVWSFQKPQADCWCWRRTSPEGEVLIEGRAAFTTFEECMEDARRHGYTGSYSVAI